MINVGTCRTVVFVLAAVIPLVTNAARIAPIQNIENQPITSTSEVTIKDVETAIILASRKRGWVLKRAEPGHLIATLDIRTHQAVLDIYFDETQYSIMYRSSVNLNYENGEIHRNYNSWIRKLDRDIQNNLPI